ncbi:coiled-coil domain-containing protein 112 isoform X2 [Canis lupus familiaris]|uniref:coiled-coil domain-containing protein 112 isoform X2 n=1 Tax=Canis lupus familiaris TaxID=9615 RepID=UPI0015F1A04C|nr:coiled-coil domain-containing protein 112 isoform X2 [Canis lupus familiaris]XP_038515678.1 coiled-coil domain-containing protein 112 isoform X2 [Canis lupus familiaris]XP_038537122.1 coiled-coil domain-containing protein 112 isoform X2 [Canis lupus familiaris]
MAALTTVVVAAAATAVAGAVAGAGAGAAPGSGVGAAQVPQQNDSGFGTSGGIRPFQLQNWKQKVSRTKKAEFIRTAEKLRNQVINIEKDKHSHFYNQKSDFRSEQSMLEELENKLINSRKTERAKIQQQLAKIHNNVKKLQHQLKDVKPTPDFVEKLREMMEEIENAINTFKEEQRLIYEELIKEEKSTNNELSAISRKIDMWALSNLGAEKAFRAMSGKLPGDKVMPSTLPEEVVDFEKFLQQTGGRQGGWDDYDHQNFVKVRNKHKGKPTFMGEVLENLPGRTQDEVQQHEKWYQKFLALEERKKEDLHKLKLKILDRQLKEDEKAEKQRKLAKLKEKVENNISRDPSRLYRPTKGWEERAKKTGSTSSGPLLHIPHRAIPTWRQGLQKRI